MAFPIENVTTADIAALRREYIDMPLDESDVDDDPFRQFTEWFEQALKADSRDATAMTLATADADGRPSARVVLLKGVDEEGLVFYTNYRSRKARELEANPWAALVFWWTELDRQVRIQGQVSKIGTDLAAEYFAQRPRGSQLSALASPQSQIISGRRELVDKIRRLDAEYADRSPACPEHWGGYRVTPVGFEFWQGRPSRLHDRIRYRLDEKGRWIIERLAP